MRNKKGFTMIELVLVVIVLGLLAAIAYPKLSQNKVTGYIGQATGIYQALNGTLHLVYGKKCAAQATTSPYDMTALTTLAEFQGIVFDASAVAAGNKFICTLGGNVFTYTLGETAGGTVFVPTTMGVITHSDWSSM